MNGSFMTPSDPDSLLVHGKQSSTTADAPPSPDSGSASPKEHYEPELRQVVDWLRTRHSTRDVPDRIEFRLPVEQFQKFQDLVQAGGEFSDQKLKYDYSPDRDHETLTLRMAGSRHEIVLSGLNERLVAFVRQAQKHLEPSIAEFASPLLPTLSSGLYYPSRGGGGETERQPNCSVTSRKHPRYPVLIGEVAASQTSQALESLAQEYIELTNGQIRTVITIDLDYPMAMGAVRVSVWRAKFAEDGKFDRVTRDDVEIRSQDGVKSPHAQVALSLSLEDFAPGGEVKHHADLQSVTLTISGDELLTIVEAAESMQAAREAFEAQWKDQVFNPDVAAQPRGTIP
ncbi:hypothetical protein AYL99_12020 [Fonsecaea erecta]|uniref:Uncharacterized protein n=1 Tax=Fonsecaea erecta TaxID=1367422 RepID=A0A178Z257_9EURO|nr:hypothetical protein AYL99_12020 [Fonsecaea erecta]OAP53777.1 hypothetical protein AYL99_12020 [Fonsecaea erecta]